MVNKVTTATVIGLDAYKVSVETDILNGLPGFSIVGLPDASINEARDRVRSAIKNSGFTFPAKKVVINLAPADLKKEGSNFDLPIAVGLLIEEGTLEEDNVKDYAFIGELSLDGSLRGVTGVLPLVLGLKNTGIKNIFVPKINATEAALAGGVNVLGAEKLADVVNHFTDSQIKSTEIDINKYLCEGIKQEYIYDFKDVKGQQKAKRALEIAAAGAHNMLMTGSPGSGKTLMAKCFSSILPPLELLEALELTKIYSISGLLSSDEPLMTKRPYRAVHHTASEMAEFPRNVLEVLRQPLEDGQIVISRAKHSIKYPAKFILLGAMNPCPCGYLGDKEKQCTCSEFQISRYKSRISGPLLDRIDLQVEVPRLTAEELLNTEPSNESSLDIRKRVIKARKIQSERYKNEGILTNSELNSKLIKKYCQIDKQSSELLKVAVAKYQLSGRRYDRILKLARTIADLESSENILQTHIMQALQYRI